MFPWIFFNFNRLFLNLLLSATSNSSSMYTLTYILKIYYRYMMHFIFVIV